MTPRLIVCDIDGTLLQGEERAVSPEIFRQIGRLAQKGIRFAPASGRQYSSLRRLFAPMADRLYYLCENGGAVFGPGDPGPLLASVPMERAAALALCRDILARQDCEVLISGANTSYLCPKGPDIIDHIRYFVGNNTAVLSAPEDVPEDILKVSAWCGNGTAEPEGDLVPRWGGTFRAAVAGAKWLDFGLADKGDGLRALCAALDIPPAEVMAFGDSWNDVPMLTLAGMPCLMEGAAPALKARFPRRCRRVEDVLRTL